MEDREFAKLLQEQYGPLEQAIVDMLKRRDPNFTTFFELHAAHRHVLERAARRHHELLKCGYRGLLLLPAHYLEGVYRQVTSRRSDQPRGCDELKALLNHQSMEEVHTGCYELGRRHVLEDNIMAVKIILDISLGHHTRAMNKTSDYHVPVTGEELFRYAVRMVDRCLK